MTESTEKKITDREAWLNIALAVARDGMPTPETFYVSQLSVDVDAATAEDAAEWAGYLNLTQRPQLASKDGERWILRWESNEKIGGRHYYVRGTKPRTPAAEPSALADQVVAAITGEVSK